MKPWIYSFDFDGTLVSVNHPQPAIQLADFLSGIDDHHYWGINTGRSFSFLYEDLQRLELNIEPDFIIAREREIYFKQDGGWTKDAQAWQHCLDKHLELLEQGSDFFSRAKHWLKQNTQATWEFEDEYLQGVIGKNHEEILAFIEWVKQDVAGQDLEDILHYEYNTIYLRFGHAGFNKGQALQQVISKFNGCPTQTVVAGDAANDLTMLRREIAHHIIAPSNACDYVKQQVLDHGGWVSLAEASHGVIDGLKGLKLVK